MGRLVILPRSILFTILLSFSMAGMNASASLVHSPAWQPAWSGYLTNEYRLDRPRVSASLSDFGFAGFSQLQVSDLSFLVPVTKTADLDPGWIRAMRFQYEKRERMHWLDQRFQIHTFFEEQEYRVAQLKAMQEGLKEIRQNLSRAQMKRLRSRLNSRMKEEEDPVFNLVKYPLGGALFVTSIGLGQPISLGVGDRARVELRTQFLDQAEMGQVRSGFLDAQVKLLSPWADSSFRFDGTAEEIRDPAKARAGDRQHRKERLSVAVTKDIPYLDVTGGVAYGTSSSLLTASLRKSLTSSLSCIVDTSTPAGEIHRGETVERSLRFEYGIQF